MSYEQIKQNYMRGLWNAAMVRLAVTKGVISQAECDEILSGK